jgi:hypothetical protein
VGSRSSSIIKLKKCTDNEIEGHSANTSKNPCKVDRFKTIFPTPLILDWDGFFFFPQFCDIENLAKIFFPKLSNSSKKTQKKNSHEDKTTIFFSPGKKKEKSYCP